MVKLFTVSVIQLYVHRINDFKELDLGYWAVRTYTKCYCGDQSCLQFMQMELINYNCAEKNFTSW